VPVFITLTANQTPQERAHTIRIAAISVAIVIAASALLGKLVLGFFSISVASLQVGGGLIVLLMALSMLNGQMGAARSTPEEAQEAEVRHSIAVVPLAIPLLTGPGSISTVIVQAERAKHASDLALLVCIGILIGLITWFALRAADPIARVLGRTGINIATRLMGLVLAALAVEFIVEGLTAMLPGLAQK
jgi:multiple antibiotic resistance protein